MKILLVDDEVEILNMLKRHLELEGFQVDTVTDPLKALDLMHQNLYNLVLTDIRMPSMLGTELIPQLKEINPLVNVVIMTGFSSMSYIVECIGEGAVDYFTKPFTHMENLMETLRHLRQKIARWQESMKR
ncbi:MAG: response regulator [Deltaproteobacteria bacterium]|nr:response regulator [Deltaproteobacteria bacterium]